MSGLEEEKEISISEVTTGNCAHRELFGGYFFYQNTKILGNLQEPPQYSSISCVKRRK